MTKIYKDMSNDEQLALIGEISSFIHNVLPELKTVKTAFTPDLVGKFNLGVALLSHFPNCRNFTSMASTICTGYPQYVNRMAMLFDIVCNSIAKEVQTSTASGENIIVLSQQQTLRRGRPTAAESEQREREKKEAARAEAIAELTGARIANVDAAPVAERPSDTSRRKQEEPTLFSAAVEEQIVNVEQDVEPNELKSLREWSWCLPEPLQLQIRELRDMRAQIAAESEQAKRLLEQGASEQEIALHTTRAKELNFKVRDLYAAVDNLLACYWIILTQLNKEYGKLAERYEKHGGYDVLVFDLEPYAKKFAADEIADLTVKAQKMNDAYIAETTKDPEKEKLFHKIDAYFRRKDVKASAARLEKMNEYYKQAQEMGASDDVLAGFRVFIEDCQKQLASTGE